MQTRTRWAVLGGVIVVAAVAFVIAQSGGGKTAQAPTTRTAGTGAVSPAPVKLVVVKGGKPVGGVQDITVRKGDQVRFTVRSDVADEIHVHGYDLHKDVAANGSVSFSFPATIDGGFVIELEKHAQQIIALKVAP